MGGCVRLPSIAECLPARLSYGAALTATWRRALTQNASRDTMRNTLCITGVTDDHLVAAGRSTDQEACRARQGQGDFEVRANPQMSRRIPSGPGARADSLGVGTRLVWLL